MSELEKFAQWVDNTPWATESLDIQADAYLRTYPGRTLQLLVELLKAADTREERECTKSKSESPITELW